MSWKQYELYFIFIPNKFEVYSAAMVAMEGYAKYWTTTQHLSEIIAKSYIILDKIPTKKQEKRCCCQKHKGKNNTLISIDNYELQNVNKLKHVVINWKG